MKKKNQGLFWKISAIVRSLHCKYLLIIALLLVIILMLVAKNNDVIDEPQIVIDTEEIDCGCEDFGVDEQNSEKQS